jgi:hypothetical protein
MNNSASLEAKFAILATELRLEAAQLAKVYRQYIKYGNQGHLGDFYAERQAANYKAQYLTKKADCQRICDILDIPVR